jgi:hypothetical protein
MPAMLRLAAIIAVLLSSGCASQPRAWERGHLADPKMAWDPDPLAAAMSEHTHVSKEAAQGGSGVGGGGCGCN